MGKDGGLAWLVVAGCFLIQFSTFGVMNSFTAFTYQMEHDASLGSPTKADLSVGNAIAAGFGPFLGLLSGLLVDHLGPAPIAFCSGAFVILSQLLGSVAPSVPVLVLLYSIPFALASATTNTPVSIAVGEGFSKKLSLALGMSYCGGGVGAAVVPLIAGQLASEYSNWRVSFRLLAPFGLLGCLGAALVHFGISRTKLEEERVRLHTPEPVSSGGANDVKREPGETAGIWQAFQGQLTASWWIIRKSRQFWGIFIAAVCFCYSYFGLLYSVIPYTASFGEAGGYYEHRAKIPIKSAVTFYTWYGVAGATGNVLFGALGYAVNTRFVFVLSSFVGAGAVILLPFLDVYIGLALVYATIGFSFAGCFSMFPALFVQSFMGPCLGTIIGIGFSSVGIGALAGPQVTAKLAEVLHGNYALSLALIAAMIGLGGFICLLFVVDPARLHPARSEQQQPEAGK